MKYNTRLLHGNLIRNNAQGSTLPPVYLTNAFEQETPERMEQVFANKAPGFVYSRVGNPTVSALENRLTLLEEGIGSVACASGMAAIHNCLMNFLQTGDEILASAGMFGGTLGLFEDLKAFGIRVRYLTQITAQAVHEQVTEQTKAVFVETIGNPRLDVTDIAAVSGAAHQHGIVCIVDNTTASSALVSPLRLGADIVVQSSSKYITGNSNAISGIITDSGRFSWDEKKYPQMAAYKKFGPFAYISKLRSTLLMNTGACLSPMSAYLNLIGLETMGLRMERICENAKQLADWLDGKKEFCTVNYPGLVSNPWHTLAKQQFSGRYGGILTLRFGSKERAYAFLHQIKIPLQVSNLGDTKTLVIHPASTIYVHSDERAREAAGVFDDMIRVSVGIEDIEDLIEDFSQALDTIGPVQNEGKQDTGGTV